ncbi:MAG: hypothetical protein JKY61_06145 [Planctomycetes bacterium]|nr:hypothetical protein [Planctomycetota bacterium]
MHWYHLIPHTFQEGSILLALYSGLCALGLGRIQDNTHRWYALLFVPFLLAYASYWIPVSLGGGDLAGEFAMWQLFFIGPWFVSGACSSLIVGSIVARVRKHKAPGATSHRRPRRRTRPSNEV